MKKYTRLFQNIGIFTLANFTTRILSFLFLPLYTNYLSTAEYGTIDLLNTMIQLLYPVFTLSIVDAVLRFGISDEREIKKIYRLGIGLILGGFVILLAGTLVVGLFIHDWVMLVCFLVIYLVQALNSFAAAFTKAIDKTKEMAIITTVISASILGLNVLFIAVLKQGMTGYWIATILGNLIGIVLYFFVCKLHRYFLRGVVFAELKPLLIQMLAYSVPLIPNALFWWINSSLDRWTITFFAGLSVVGLYSCANKIPTILSTINTVFNQAWNLSLFQCYEDEERDSFFRNTYHYFNEVMFCCSIGIIMLSKLVGTLMFAKEFYVAWIYIPLLTVGLYYNCLNGFLGSLFTASKKTKSIFTTTAVGSAVNLVLNFPMVYFWGVSGAAVATLISYLMVFLMRNYKVRQLFGLRTDAKRALFQFVFLLVEVCIVMSDHLWWLTVSMVAVYCLVFAGTTLRDIFRKRGK